MSKYPAIILHRNKAHAVKRFHPWVFSGAIKKTERGLIDGEIAEVYSDSGEYLGIGHYGTGSIAVRIFSFEKVDNLQELWFSKFRNAYELRKTSGLTNNANTNAYRLINAEGDGLPGLIIDWYNGTAVLQAHTIGMHAQSVNFVESLKNIYKDELQCAYNKSDSTLHSPKGTKASDGFLFGDTTEAVILENGCRFLVNWEQGQKTGFFLDQRDNRQLLGQYSSGKKVLNTFCYSGGFSVYALREDASAVHSVDSSAKAIALADKNVELNFPDVSKHQSFAMDVFEFLQQATADYDLVILDPPAFAKGQSARHSAIKAYTRLNRMALDKIKSGGVLFTFSCSQVVSREMFEGAVTAAAIESGRNIKILHHLTQGSDHPVSIFHPEGSYLKGLVLYVE